MLSLLLSLLQELIPQRPTSFVNPVRPYSPIPDAGRHDDPARKAREHGMSHPSYEVLSRYSKRDTSDEVLQVIEEHLENCESCRVQLEYVDWFNELSEKGHRV